VLFTDLAGATELRSRIGETTFRVLRHRHDGLLREVVVQYRGEAVKFLGDGVMQFTTVGELPSKGWLLRFQRARSHGRRLVLRRPSLP
jgi:class 3 adenylate cyclase